MLNKEVLINIFQKLFEGAKNFYDEFNLADGKIGDGDLGITILNGFEEINNNINKFNDDMGSNFMICAGKLNNIYLCRFDTRVTTNKICSNLVFSNYVH